MRVRQGGQEGRQAEHGKARQMNDWFPAGGKLHQTAMFVYTGKYVVRKPTMRRTWCISTALEYKEASGACKLRQTAHVGKS